MTCRELIEFLADYLSGDIPDSERAVFQEHLASCPPCVAYLKTYQDTILLGKGACCPPDEHLPKDLPEQLVQAILAARKNTA